MLPEGNAEGFFSKFLRSHDDFGQPVTMTYKGESSYKTSCGGFLTLLARMLSFAFFAYLLVDFVTKNRTVPFQTFERSFASDGKLAVSAVTG